ncbi:ABC transporter permease subunit [Congregibacter sp.]|uniref:ABC transporter permease subunit n=1 Tax=Congregibacter sp. TaxID=2744308 RepID=UPI003F6CD802
MVDARTRIASRRRAWDRAASLAINAAGAAVILLLLMILMYLLYVTLPLASPAKLEARSVQGLSFAGAASVLVGDALVKVPGVAEAGVLLSDERYAANLGDDVLQLFELKLPGAVAGRSPADAVLREALLAPGAVPESLDVHSDGDRLMFAYLDDGGLLHAGVVNFAELPDPVITRYATSATAMAAGMIRVDAATGTVFVLNDHSYLRWQPKAAESNRLLEATLPGFKASASLVAWGPNHETLLVVDANNELYRFDTARAALPLLGPPIDVGMKVRWLASESSRRVVYLLSEAGELVILVPSSAEELLRQTVSELRGPGRLGVSADGAFVYRLSDKELLRVALDNPFPETGWKSLWLPQWFGAYDAPGQYWHSDGAAIGALSKLSLSPLLYGTFKAAVYGMLLAIPLSLGAAVYTGYFLSPRVRNRIKPSIELLEAFPTVVLGFVAGLWLAPLLLDYLLPILLLPLVLLGLPLLLSVIHLLLQVLSPKFQRRPPRIALISVVYIAAIIALMLNAQNLEAWLFENSLRDWLWTEWGIAYEQRNALLVGLAMGVAITPVMFSIVEDSIFAVPRSLSDGSLALGATRWQSLARVVLPAASPAILSALLIGLARGLGETMIVLLATGNTPLMEPGMFSGLRSLSASIVVELPEAGSRSVQFRLLFLAALVLFGLTFVLNTIAELFRQRLRYAYASR